MKLIVIVASLALSACALIPDKVQLPAGQGLLVAEAAMDGANHAATVAATSGFLSGEPARKVHAAIDGGNNAVSAAHRLYAHGDIPGTVSQLQEALKDVADIQSATKAPQ